MIKQDKNKKIINSSSSEKKKILFASANQTSLINPVYPVKKITTGEVRLKKSLGDILLRKRDSIKLEEKKIKEAVIKKRLFALVDFKKAKSILFYASFRSEVNTIPCIQHALKLRKRITLPLVDEKKRELRLYKIKDVSELVSGYLGIPEPGITKGREMSLRDIDAVIIPGAGFDVNGNRLGYGLGYYDKLLSCESERLSKPKKHITTIALAFEKQIVPKVPDEIHDVKIDKIITEKRVINCQIKKGIKGSRGLSLG